MEVSFARVRRPTVNTTEAPSREQLETFDNPRPGRDYTIEIVCPEFTSLCPKTGQPDFGTITFRYVPAESCIELKSLKLYLQRYRNVGAFYESVVNQLLDDFVAACSPKSCQIIGAFTPRGGITTTVTCRYDAVSTG
jgi:7-cyano-7-deazaguanine reductase